MFASVSVPECQLRWGRAAPRAAAGAPWKPGRGGGGQPRHAARFLRAPRLEYKKGVIVGGVGGQGAPKVVVVAACQQAQRTGRHLLVHRSLVRLQAGGGAGAGRHARAPLHKPPPTHSSPEERHHAAGQECRPRQAGCPAANRGARPVPRTSRILSCAGVSANCWSLGLRPEMKCPGGSSCHCSRAESGGRSCEGTGETVARHATHKHTGGGSGPRGRLPISPPQNSRGKHGRLRQTARTRPVSARGPRAVQLAGSAGAGKAPPHLHGAVVGGHVRRGVGQADRAVFVQAVEQRLAARGVARGKHLPLFAVKQHKRVLALQRGGRRRGPVGLAARRVHCEQAAHADGCCSCRCAGRESQGRNRRSPTPQEAGLAWRSFHSRARLPAAACCRAVENQSPLCTHGCC